MDLAQLSSISKETIQKMTNKQIAQNLQTALLDLEGKFIFEEM